MKKLLSGVLVFCMIVSMLFVVAYAASEAKIYTDRYGDWTYVENDDGNTVAIVDYSGNVADVVIPRTIDGKRVTSINGALFKNNSAVRNVYILFDVRFSDSFFEGCEDITFYAMANSQTAQSLMEHLGDVFAVRVITPNPDVAAAVAAAAGKTEDGIEVTTYEDENSTGKYVNCTPEDIFAVPGPANTTTAYGELTNNEETDDVNIGVFTYDSDGNISAGAGFGKSSNKDGGLEYVYSAVGSAEDYTNISYGFGEDGKVSDYMYTDENSTASTTESYIKDSENLAEVSYENVDKTTDVEKKITIKDTSETTFMEALSYRKPSSESDEKSVGWDWEWEYETVDDVNYVTAFTVTEYTADENAAKKTTSVSLTYGRPATDAAFNFKTDNAPSFPDDLIKILNIYDVFYEVMNAEDGVVLQANPYAEADGSYIGMYYTDGNDLKYYESHDGGNTWIDGDTGDEMSAELKAEIEVVKKVLTDGLSGNSELEGTNQGAILGGMLEDEETLLKDVADIAATTPDGAIDDCSNNFASAADIIPDFDSYVEAVTPDVSDSNSGNSGNDGANASGNGGASASGSTGGAGFGGGSANASGSTGDSAFSNTPNAEV